MTSITAIAGLRLAAYCSRVAAKISPNRTSWWVHKFDRFCWSLVFAVLDLVLDQSSVFAELDEIEADRRCDEESFHAINDLHLALADTAGALCDWDCELTDGRLDVTTHRARQVKMVASSLEFAIDAISRVGVAGERSFPSARPLPSNTLTTIGLLVFGVSFTTWSEAVHRWRTQSRARLALPPGTSLMTLAAFLFSAKTVERVFRPTFRDAVDEWQSANERREHKRIAWIHIRTWLEFVRVATLHVLGQFAPFIDVIRRILF